MTEPRVGRMGSFETTEAEEPYEGVTRRTFDAHRATVTQYTFVPGARFPLHRHPQEQVTVIEEGTVVFTVAGVSHELTAGDWSVVPGGVEHGMEAGAAGARFLAVVVPRRTGAVPYVISSDGRAP